MKANNITAVVDKDEPLTSLLIHRKSSSLFSWLSIQGGSTIVALFSVGTHYYLAGNNKFHQKK